MANKLIIDCNTGDIIKENYTKEELSRMEKEKQDEILNPNITEEKVDTEKVAVAEAIVDLNNQIENLKEEINNLKGGK